jgi:hypothetical protein
MKWYAFKFQIRKWQAKDGRYTNLESVTVVHGIGRDWQEAIERMKVFFQPVRIEIGDLEWRVELSGMYNCEHFNLPEPEAEATRKIEI